MVAHRVVSPLLFGLKTGGGLGSNADELRQADELMRTNVIDPSRDVILDHLQPLFKTLGIAQITWLDKKSDTTQTTPATPDTALKLSKQTDSDAEAMAKFLEDHGEDIDENEWVLIDAAPEDYRDVEQKVNAINLGVRLASVPSSNPNGKSEQDTSLFKVRYTYAPKVTDAAGPSRKFCSKMVASSKVYRKEDILAASDRAVNPGFGPGGSNTYDLWLYKGGPNCHHFWERRIYMRRNNKKITETEARKMISDLSPDERPEAKWEKNDSDVARRPIDMPNRGYLNPPGN